MDFERGLKTLKARAKHSDWEHDVLLYEARLLLALQDEKRYGPAPQTSQELRRVIESLNDLCSQHLGVSFNDLCIDSVVPAPVSSANHLMRPLGATVCFYSQKDVSFYNALKTSLSLWQQQNKINWLDISPGYNILTTQKQHLSQANLILLLCSPDFFAESTCYEAMNKALEEHTRRQVPVVPILARACGWEESPCASLEVLPENRRPINQWAQSDQAYESIRRSLIRLSAQP